MSDHKRNTSGLIPFEKGKSGNPGGMSKEQARLIRENAEAASRIRAKLLSATEETLASAGPTTIMESIEAAMLKLLQDSETRGLGAPVQHVDNTSSDGSMTPRASELTDEQLARIISGNDK